ncbi:hypothetical protein QWI17_13000 [Gilvimarinus sp. SDUM040013]|uniref:Solute-binding protein family 3/N-terminal domain-containing protein n=1 Tax=Gilvimarinus gilvus TaxID=3058038 RepID=A0ABU4RXB3_9GAMM|nr:hypothetical protein [Gilvimarinus sp. SDUM040013]MDO3386757.1 hypothetical protein [Gilvimarinus sp. SDUM040013]MDX6848313.1 hypothetical protein [Gilvimarinus sp. SDUM040013]
MPIFSSRRQRLLTAWALAIAMCLLALPLYAAPLRVTATPDILDDYEVFMDGRRVEDVNYYGGAGARRDVIELLLLQKALKLGGFEKELTFIPEQNYRRTLYRVAAGELISSGALVWLEDTRPIAEDVRVSSAVVRNGNFKVGLYTSADNKTALATTFANLNRLSAVSNANWKTDINTLEILGFERIYLANSWISMVKMLAAQRADVTLAPFQPGDSMAIRQQEGVLIPIPGIKIALKGSRHWVVSRNHPDANAYFQALQTGIRHLQQSGTIARAYRESGFYHPQVKQWRTLNAPAITPTAP